jgi:hypothetical protein
LHFAVFKKVHGGSGIFMYGEKILETGMDNSSARTLSLSGRPAGVYYIRVETGHFVMAAKVVKL